MTTTQLYGVFKIKSSNKHKVSTVNLCLPQAKRIKLLRNRLTTHFTASFPMMKHHLRHSFRAFIQPRIKNKNKIKSLVNSKSNKLSKFMCQLLLLHLRTPYVLPYLLYLQLNLNYHSALAKQQTTSHNLLICLFKSQA